MSFNNTICVVCGCDQDVIVSLPTTKVMLNEWATILQTPSLIINSRQKKICLKHFKPSYHLILKNPVCRRGLFIKPLEYDGNQSISEQDEICNLFSVSTKRPLETSEKQAKKSVNYDLLLAQKNDEISNLTEKIKELNYKSMI